jgi:cysteine-rich repeat protein
MYVQTEPKIVPLNQVASEAFDMQLTGTFCRLVPLLLLFCLLVSPTTAHALNLDATVLQAIPGNERYFCAPVDGLQHYQLVQIKKNQAKPLVGTVQVKLLKKKKLKNRLRRLRTRDNMRALRRMKKKLRLSRSCKKKTPSTSAGSEIFLFSFSEGRGAGTKDNSKNKIEAALSGSYSWSASGLRGGSLLFTDARASLDIANGKFPEGSELSFHTWALPLYPDGIPDMRLFSKAKGTATEDHDLMLSMIGQERNVRIRLRTSIGTKTHIADTAAFKPGQWTHIAFTYDGQTVRLYQDGLETDTFSQSGALSFRSALKTTIGNQPDGAGDKGFNGYLDEVALYGKVLTANEIETLASNTPSSLPPFCGNSTCDEDENASSCPSDCNANCGNNLIEPGEQCDDGNDVNSDGCNRDCQLETECNDGIDNDFDGATDNADYSCGKGDRDSESAFLAACQDGIDNDSDGDTDYPDDAECFNNQYNSEEALGCGCPGVEKPGPSNTGPNNSGALTAYSGPTKITSDTTIENKIITSTLTITDGARLVIRNFTITTGGYYGINVKDGSLLAEHGEIQGMRSSALLGSNITARYLNIHESGGDGMKLGGNSLAEYNWVHHLGTNEGSHADANQTRSGSNITLRCNNMDIPINEKGGPGSPYKSNATSINQAENGPISNLVMDGNWLNGGNYTVYYIGGAYTNSGGRLKNNCFGRAYRYGLLRTQGDIPDFLACNNRWEDSDVLISDFTQQASCP